ncbi:hypothetical protein [Halococcus saccharolyticus]|uniref:Uncharacterized protein n=1 Tax=Halococcus saccharolyticus DSM 5350 TaxID=1227455 RepID=M0MFL6_9EURY|nr:hypothetical protein [Halococcus saccharolyticus]EMA43225.1 hypothetical protein C449_14642 [Halococcus saccharolyticus DSM 5350]
MDDEPTDLDGTERAALHDLQLGIEHLHRGYGHLVAFHHQVGRGMDRLDDAREKLRTSGHDEWADVLRDDLLPAGAVDGRWTYEVVEAFADEFLTPAAEFETGVRDVLADGRRHVTERRQQREWRERSESDRRADR